jgi:outer membrane protein assembly factor BamB
MSAGRHVAIFLLGFFAISSELLFAQDNSAGSQEGQPTIQQEVAPEVAPEEVAPQDSLWRISPEKINIQLGNDRALQLLDDSAQELKGATWSLDNPDLAEIRVEDGLIVVHPKAVGTVVVTATLGEETRTREIKIWSALRPLPIGTTKYGLHPIGREIGDIPAVPGDGPTMFSLEQTESGLTYLRAGRVDGIQLWTWLMPETAHDVELVCGDWMGGALVSANYEDHFTLYTVGKDGKLRWKHSFAGIRKGHAYNLQHLVHILSQSADGTVTTLTALDEESGAVKFQLRPPASHESEKNVKQDGSKVVCATGLATNVMRTIVSRISVNMDGYAYFAFTQNEWTLDGGKCTPGEVMDPHTLNFTRDERLILWQVHPDGTYHSIPVEATKLTQQLSAPTSVASPTGAIVTDNMNGTLIPVRMSHNVMPENTTDPADEFIYRVNQDGEVVYKLPLPKYVGPLRDEMVIGSDELGFATRGGMLIAFNVRDGKELWQWDSKTNDISVLAALADGSCLVQTPTDAVKVESSTKAKIVLHGKLLLGWDGQAYRKHN